MILEKFFDRYPVFRYSPAFINMAIIFNLSGTSGSNLPSFPIGIDKVFHMIAFAALGVSFAFWFKPPTWKIKPIKIVFLVIALSTLFGISDEFHQYFVPGRNASIYDVIADFLGASLAAVSYYFYVNFFSKKMAS